MTDRRTGVRRSLLAVVAGMSLLLGAIGMSPADAQSEFVVGTFRLRGTTGDEFVDFTGDGGFLAERDLPTTWTEVAVLIPLGTSKVRVNFVNDGPAAGGADRNVIVDRLRLENGITIEAESSEVLSKGVWNGTDCGEGYRNSEFLACNGWFEFDVEGLLDTESPPPPDGPKVPLSYVASGATGTEQVGVEVNGEVVLTTVIEKGLKEYSADVDPVAFETIRLVFLNDGRDANGADRNVFFETVTFDGVTLDPTTLESKGTWNGVDCGVGFRNSNWLHCDGWFDIPVDDSTEPPPPPPAGDRFIGASARGTTGTEIIGLEVNGQITETVTLTKTDTWYDFGIPDGEITSLRFVFTNDAITVDGDRNVWFTAFDPSFAPILNPKDLKSKGSWNGVDCGEGFRNTNWLNCNGWFEIPVDGLDDNPPPPPPPPPGGDRWVAANARGTTGSEIIGLEVNGEITETVTLTTTNTWYDFAIPDGEVTSLRIVFTNDAITADGDRNVWFTAFELSSGLILNPKDLLSKGSWNGVDCGEGYRSTNWLNCNGWFEIPLEDLTPTPPPAAPSDLSCISADAADGSSVSATIWSWSYTNFDRAELVNQNTRITLEIDGVETEHLMPYSYNGRFVYEGADPHRVTEIAALSEDGQVSATAADGVTCGGAVTVSYSVPRLIDGEDPGSLSFEFFQVFGRETVDHYVVELIGETRSVRQEVVPGDEGRQSVVFDDVPTDEVLRVEIRACFQQPFSACEDYDGVRYATFGGLYAVSDNPPANSALGPPENMAFGPQARSLTWDPPTTTDGLAIRYEVRVFEEFGVSNDFLQATAFKAGPPEGEPITETTITLADTGLGRQGENSTQRFEVRACTDNGCGPWSNSTDWSGPGGVFPFVP